MREASEQVSFYRGELLEGQRFQRLFSRIFTNALTIISLKTRLSLFHRGYGAISFALGLALSIPFYLAKAFPLGTVMQISSAYNSVISGFSAFIDAFDELSDWRSVVHRLAEFDHSMEKLTQPNTPHITVGKYTKRTLVVKNLQLDLPAGKKLLNKLNLSFTCGQHLLLKSRSGVGKSIFLRALASIWSHGEGEIYLPKHAKILFLPQKPYLLVGTLKEVLCYPQQKSPDSAFLNHVLTLCSLGKFQSKLDVTENWSHQLSLGEQQPIAFARVFLYKPDILFLDEATSALDAKHESMLYQNIVDLLPNLTMISVGHKESLEAFHHDIIHLAS